MEQHGRFFDGAKASRLMRDAEIDALLITKPENFRYVTGASPGFVSSWRYATSQMALLPLVGASAVVLPDIVANGFRKASPIADIRLLPVWTDSLSVRDLLPSDEETAVLTERAARADTKRPDKRRPASYDRNLAVQMLVDLVRERGLRSATIGIELDFVPAAEFELLSTHLRGVRLVDCSQIIRLLRLVKHPEELELLRVGSHIAERGIAATLEAARAGMSTFDLTQIFHNAMADEARRLNRVDYEGPWSALSVGPDTWGGGRSAQVGRGTIIKFDGGCSLGGYVSDIGRTYVFGSGSNHHRRLHDALVNAFDAGLHAFHVGNTLADVYAAATKAMQSSGFNHYNRGHFGHSIGSDIWSEEWPFISADEETVLEPRMIFSFEMPHYVDGLGGFIIEDQIQVSDAGPNNMGTLDRAYSELEYR